jgi:hypothetical protein
MDYSSQMQRGDNFQQAGCVLHGQILGNGFIPEGLCHAFSIDKFQYEKWIGWIIRPVHISNHVLTYLLFVTVRSLPARFVVD